MGGLLGPLLAAGGGVADSALDFFSAKQARELDWEHQRGIMRWQEYMANTAHQREVADLRKAGLNPLLSVTGGAGAPTPNPGSPVPSKTPGPSRLGASAASAVQLRLDQQRVKNETVLAAAEAQRKDVETRLLQEQVPKVGAETRVLEKKLEEIASLIGLQGAQKEYSQTSAEGARKEFPEKEARGEVFMLIRELLRAIKGGRSDKATAREFVDVVKEFFDSGELTLPKVIFKGGGMGPRLNVPSFGGPNSAKSHVTKPFTLPAHGASGYSGRKATR